MWYDSAGSSFLKLPMNSELTFTIKSVSKITDKPQFDFKNSEGVSAGYHYEMETDKGTLTIGAWKLFFAFKSAQAGEGDTVKVVHGGKGEYLVKKFDEGSPF